MSPLERRIAERQAQVDADREALSRHLHGLGSALHRELATPKALAAGFGTGFLAGVLRPRHRGTRGMPAEPNAEAPLGPLLSWLLRDVAVPLALGILSTRGRGDT